MDGFLSDSSKCSPSAARHFAAAAAAPPQLPPRTLATAPMDGFPCDSSKCSPTAAHHFAAAAAAPPWGEEISYATVSSVPPKRRAGRIKFRETRHPVYKGVRRRNGDKWVCEVREPRNQSRIWLGTFPSAEMAARAHDVAAMALRGRSACLNFADSASLLRVPGSSNPRDIQMAAAEAAEMFRPRKCRGPSKQLLKDTASTGKVTSDAAAAGPCLRAEELLCMDDGFCFGMQGYIDMAEGLLIEPPMLHPANAEEEEESEVEVALWSYSF